MPFSSFAGSFESKTDIRGPTTVTVFAARLGIGKNTVLLLKSFFSLLKVKEIEIEKKKKKKREKSK